MPLLLPVHVHSMLCCCWEKQAFSILWALSAFAIYVSNSEDGKFYWGYNRKWCKHHYKVLKIHKGANILMESKSNWNFYIYWILTRPFNNVKVRIFWEGHRIWKNLPLKIWCDSVTSNFKLKIFSNFVAFSEYPNFKFWR